MKYSQFLSGAVLTIGSLFWDNDGREIWQNERIKKEKNIKVLAPIRYGRKSSTRGNTYTMVFSQLCYRMDDGLGIALLVPLKNQISSFTELKLEATELWKAERKISGSLGDEMARKWGAVGLILNPDVEFDYEIINNWNALYRSQPVSPDFAHSKNERPSINPNGFLNLRWPEEVSNSIPVSFDFILATANNPTLENNRYPSPRMIAEAWLTDIKGNIDYFVNNRKNGITTFQDDAIQKFLGDI